MESTTMFGILINVSLCWEVWSTKSSKQERLDRSVHFLIFLEHKLRSIRLNPSNCDSYKHLAINYLIYLIIKTEYIFLIWYHNELLSIEWYNHDKFRSLLFLPPTQMYNKAQWELSLSEKVLDHNISNA